MGRSASRATDSAGRVVDDEGGMMIVREGVGAAYDRRVTSTKVEYSASARFESMACQRLIISADDEQNSVTV